MAIKPITGILRRRLVVDLGLAFGIGMVAGNSFWYGFHVPRRNQRDVYYKKLEDAAAERAAA